MPPPPKETDELDPAQAAGLTLGAVAIAGLLGLFIWYQTRRRRLRRRLGQLLSSPPRSSGRDDDGGGGDISEINNNKPQAVDVLGDRRTRLTRKREPSVGVLAVPPTSPRSPHHHHALYMDDKVELPVPKAMRTRTRDSDSERERDLYGGGLRRWEDEDGYLESKKTGGGAVFADPWHHHDHHDDGDNDNGRRHHHLFLHHLRHHEPPPHRGPFELPGVPAAAAAARNASWRTGASSLFHHRPLPRFARAEGGERRSLTPPPPPPPSSSALVVKTTTAPRLENMAVSPLSAGVDRGSNSASREGAAPRDGEVSPLTPAPLVPRDMKQSLNGVLEEQVGGGEGLKETVTAAEKTEMLNNDKWLTWRRFGGGAGTG